MNTAQLNRRQAKQLVDSALKMGLSHAVVSPGARNTPLVLALHDAVEAGASIQLFSVIDERAAGFFALGIARRSDTPVLLSCTSGSAAANYLPAIVEASEGQVPLLVVTADRPEELQDSGAPQTMPQKDLYGCHVRVAISLDAPSDLTAITDVADAVFDCWTGAMGTRPGPTQLNLRFRKPLWTPEDTAFDPAPMGALRSSAPAVHSQDLQRLIHETEGKNGILVVGTDSSRRISSAAVVTLANRLGWPILADPVNGLRFGSTGPIVRHHDILLRSDKLVDSLRPEVAIIVGGTTSSHPLETLLRSTPSISIRPDTDQWNPWGSVDWTLQNSLSTVVTALEEMALTSTSDAWCDGWIAADTVAADAIRGACKEGLWEGSIAHHLVASLPTNTLLRIASSMPIRDVDSFAVDDGKCLTVSSNRGVNGIDGTIATTFGEATVHQGPVATLMGDLSFIHDASALLTTPHPTQPTVITVVNNGGGGIFGFLPMRKHSTGFEPWYVTPHKHDIRAICEAAQVAVYEPNNLADYMESISSALQTNGVTVVHVKIDRKASTDKHFQAWSDVCSAVEAAQ